MRETYLKDIKGITKDIRTSWEISTKKLANSGVSFVEAVLTVFEVNKQIAELYLEEGSKILSKIEKAENKEHSGN